MVKKILTVFLSAALCVGVVFSVAACKDTSASENDGTTEQTQGGNQGSDMEQETQELEYEYDPETDSYIVAGIGNITLTEIEIPTSYNGKPVTEIGEYAFKGCSFTSVTLPDSVTSIKVSAFEGCEALLSITFPDGLTSIGSEAFYHCKSLSNITFPDSVTSIGSEAFCGCTSLASIEIPDGVTEIERGVFNGCTSLASITLPDSVTEIGDAAFDGTAYYNNGYRWMNGVLYIGNHLIKAKDTIMSEYKIKSGTKTIADHAFTNYTRSSSSEQYSGCKSLQSLTIPDSVTVIGFEAFRNCTSLSSVEIGDGVTEIWSGTFQDCTSLICFKIGDGLTTIWGGAFYDCTSLTSVMIGNGLTTIWGGAFENCTSLVQIEYEGTLAQWENVKKQPGWYNDYKILRLVCSDGELTGEEIG